MERHGLQRLRPVTEDTGAGDWIMNGLDDNAGHPTYTVTGTLLPTGFDAYARLLHPAEDLTWATVAATNGRHAHPLMQWPGITGPDDEEPSEGTLPAVQAARLLAVLQRHTTSAGCHYAAWEGSGALAVPEKGTARLDMPGRSMLLLHGPLADAATVSTDFAPFQNSPNLWWPDDRAWCVATDIDLMSTYIGASAACIAEILAAPGLETWPARPDDPITYAGDTLNPTR
ncbi:hypothetical protein [Actinoplanes couchii]|uniref:DUF317 domain-containing protein n=1 Tax=Actinoplanes couchii TaxID=403638 RepID=A0ABQ3XLX3_9ACTN|nr:hypothetical protein [Actinoplanes couchii]MDR6319313.1 hypothetical protein [Actinoplanes couchii]GID59478.1 hypothetical protein Aco03nite_078820 [Actinoplanes couchii]